MAKRPEMLGRFLVERDSSNAARNLGVRQIAPLHDPNSGDADNRRFLPPSRTPSDLSSTSSTSASNYPQSEASSTESAASTATSLSDSPPPPPPYTLPCLMLGCQIEFFPAQFHYWYSHSLSHFEHLPPPPKSMCIFCDDDNAIFENAADLWEAWGRRMRHIEGHFRQLLSPIYAKPDFLVINYMGKNNLLSEEDYRDAVGYTERKFCEEPVSSDFVSNDFVTPEMVVEKERRERSEREYIDVAKEKRQHLRQEKQKRKDQGQGEGAHRSSHRSRIDFGVQVKNER